jgi:DNA-binding SARP family transcriptional activator
MPGLLLGLLGPLYVVRDGMPAEVPAAKQRVVLAALLVNANRVVLTDELTEMVWDVTPPPTADVTMRNYVRRLRLALGPGFGSRIVTRDRGYQIDVADDELDLLGFTNLCGIGRAAARSRDWRQASAALGRALDLWRDRPLADIPSKILQRDEVPRLWELRLQALEWRIEADLHQGNDDRLVPELQVLTAQHPLRERFQLQLILALYRGGRRAEALDAYQRARRTLLDEIGIEPGRDLRQLQQRILAGDASLATHVRPPSAGSAATAAPAVSGTAPRDEPREPAQPGGFRVRPARTIIAPRQLPAAMPRFVGRKDEMSSLTGLLKAVADSRGAPAVAAVVGTAGVGKTVLAVYWAHQVADHFPDGQLYADLQGCGPSGKPKTAEQAIRGFLEAFGVAAGQMPAGLDAQAALYRSVLVGKRVLVLLDNAHDADHVHPLLPGSPGCLALITSRKHLAGLAVTEGAQLLTLGPLAQAEARELLDGWLGPKRVAAEPETVGELTEPTGLCAGLPLALSIVAARAAPRPDLPLASLASELRDSACLLDALDAGEQRASIRTVFSWSFRHLTPCAARTYRLLGLHPRPDISAAAVASLVGLPPTQARLALAELVRMHMLSEHATGRFAFHNLLHAYAAEEAQAHYGEQECSDAIRRMLDHYLHTAHAANRWLHSAVDPVTLAMPHPGVEPIRLTSRDEALAWLEAEQRVLVAVISDAVCNGFNSYAWQIARTLVPFLGRRGHWHDLAATQASALVAAQRLGDRAWQALAHLSLVHAFVQLGCYPEARIHLERALNLS